MPKIFIPTALRQYAGNTDAVTLQGSTVKEVLTGLTEQFPELKKHLYSEAGKLRSFVNIYVNDEDIRYAKQEETTVKENDEISIIPSIAGGSIDLLEATGSVELTNEEVKRYSRHLIMPEVA